jgi:hypothetical protein
MNGYDMKSRKAIEDKVIAVMNMLDNTGSNARRYKLFFKSMSDEQFKKFIKDMKDDKNWFMLEVLPENEPSLPMIKDAAEFLKVPLEEYLYINHNTNGKTVKTDTKMSVGYLSIKRLQQLLSKKNNVTLDANKRNVRTGALVNDDKASRISDVEMYALTVMGADAVKKELLSFRADSMDGKQQMLSQIMLQGYANQADINTDPKDSTTLNTVDIYFLGAGIKSNLISDTLLLKHEEKKLKAKLNV